MGKTVLLPWCDDPEINRQNIEDAMNSGATELNEERDENGNPSHATTPGAHDVITLDENTAGAGKVGGLVHFGFRLELCV